MGDSGYLCGRHLLPELNVVCGGPVPVQLVCAFHRCPKLPSAGVSISCTSSAASGS